MFNSSLQIHTSSKLDRLEENLTPQDPTFTDSKDLNEIISQSTLTYGQMIDALLLISAICMIVIGMNTNYWYISSIYIKVNSLI